MRVVLAPIHHLLMRQWCREVLETYQNDRNIGAIKRNSIFSNYFWSYLS